MIGPGNRWQFSLWHLLALVACAAALLGTGRLLGPGWPLLGLAIAAAAILTFVVRRRRFVWLLPLLWTPVAWFNFHHPGDEYGGFAAGSLAGLWIAILFDLGGNPGDLLPPILAAGVMTLAIAGLVLDKLRTPLGPWLFLWIAAAIGIFLWVHSQFPSPQRVIGKMGSYWALVLPAVNLGLYTATAVLGGATALYRAVLRFTRRKQHKMTLPPSPDQGDGG